ncbi:vWA domain-containing protein, partial [Candidatus Hakubella thermalkaliphila]
MDDPENPQSSVTKLDRAIEGLREIAGQIRSNDRFSLIAFDDHVAPMITGASGEERHRILNAIDQLRCRFHGGTNVYGALEQAYANLQTSEMSLNPVQTVILLTDGEITVGRGEKDCCRLATKMAEQGIVIDTLGYGTN